MAAQTSLNRAIRAWARSAYVGLARLVAPPRRLPRAGQIVLQHLRRRAQQQVRDQFTAKAESSRRSFLRDLVDFEEDPSRQPGE